MGGSESASVAQVPRQRGRHHLVSVEDEDPVAAGLGHGEAPGRVGDAARALMLVDGGAHAFGDGGGVILAVLVDHDDLVAPRQQGGQCVVQLVGLVEGDDDAADPGHGLELHLADRLGSLLQTLQLGRVDGRQLRNVLEAQHLLLEALVLPRAAL